jgi:4-carboxymuconolactone decarboxylase
MREESWRDFAFSEVWTQPVMSRRARYLVALASEVLTGADDAIRGDYVRSALKSGEHSVAELREAALRLGPCAGWAGATRLDKAVTPAVRALGSRSAKPARVAPNPGTQERAMHSTHSLSPVDAYP